VRRMLEPFISSPPSRAGADESRSRGGFLTKCVPEIRGSDGLERFF
jgi:hypothetical protein